MKTTILTLIFSMTLATLAQAALTEEKCQSKKLIALGKRTACVQKEQAKELVGRPANPARCRASFDSAIASLDEVAARRGIACQWLERGDGTATDLNSGLQWELKTDPADSPLFGSIHEVDNRYSWCAGDSSTCDIPWAPADGGAFTHFLGTLNGAGYSSYADDGDVRGCLAGKCDWRIPTREELQSLIEESVPGCSVGIELCTTIPGETAQLCYWSVSSSVTVPEAAWLVNFYDGSVGAGKKFSSCHVRAVRGAM